MRIINANYAKYYNKKYTRSGHLRQDRHKSKLDYLYTLIKYNPIEAGVAQKVGEYPFTLASLIFSANTDYPCSSESLLLKEFDLRTLCDFLGSPLTQDELEYLQKKRETKSFKKQRWHHNETI